ncbi:MAG: hypothetical protein IKX76_02080, partial [Eubacterium sp.]|nr:hypothetical protein [Eubacterium sp.]
MKEEKKKNSNIGMKILSVGIAFLIWLLVTNTNDPVITKHFSDVTVQVKNENALTDNGYAYKIIEGDVVSFSVKGKRSILSNLSVDDFSVVADFSKLSLTDAIPIDVTCSKYQDQLEINLGSVNTMKIEKDEVISVNLPVNATVNGNVAEGFYVGEANTTPNLIRVTGPENLLEKAKEIRAVVDMDQITENFTVSAKPELYDANGETIQSSQITMDVSTVNVSVVLWKTKNVKVKVGYYGKPESGYTITEFDYEPKTIRVAVSDDFYDDLDSVDLGEVSLSGRNSNYEKNIEIDSTTFPDGVILAENTSSIKISAKIEEIITRRVYFDKADLKVKNKSGFKVTYNSGNKYYMDIEGTKSKVNNVKASEFQPWIDLNGLEEGEREVKI